MYLLEVCMYRILWLLPLMTWLPAQASDNFLPPEQAFQLSVTETGAGQVRLHWRVSEGYYLYRKQLKIEAEPAGKMQAIEFPAGTMKNDEFFGESEVYHDSVELLVTAPGVRALTIGWQGCADAGLCYPPQSRRVELKMSGTAIGTETGTETGTGTGAVPLDNAGKNAGPPAAGMDQPAGALSEDQSLAKRLARGNLAWTLMVFFGLGLLMTFTPCVLPMIPILSSLIAGSGAGPKRGFVLSLAFVLPMALTYAVLGAAAALAGANLQAMLQNSWVLGTFGLVFVALALAMFGFYELQLPAFLRNRLDRASQGQRGGTLSGAAAMGVLSALLVGPCMTAPLAGALLYIGDTGDVVSGGLALLFMGLGMGVPLLLVGTLGAKLLPRPGNWMNRVKTLFGFILLATAIFFVARVLPPALALGLWGAWLLACALALLTLAAKLARDYCGQLLTRFAALLLGLWGVLMVIGAAAGAADPLQPLAFVSRTTDSSYTVGTQDFMERFIKIETPQQLANGVAAAGQRGQWTLVDFYADWCVSCKVIERNVFSDPRVQQALADMQLLRPDITENNANDRAMLSAYQAFGAPTLLLIGPDGKEYRAGRIIGELSADEFVTRLTRAKESI